MFSVHVAKICEAFGDLFAFHQHCLWADSISSWSSHLTPISAVSHACCSTGPKFLRSCQDLRGAAGPSAAWSVTSSQDDGRTGTGQADGGEKRSSPINLRAFAALHVHVAGWRQSLLPARVAFE